MSNSTPFRGRPNNKVARTVTSLQELERADRLVDSALLLQGQAYDQFRANLEALNKNEFARYLQAVEKIQADE